MSLRCMSRLVLRALTKIYALSPGSPMASQADGESALVGTGSPELPVEILMDIFALLEIPDLVRAGSVCSSWHAAYGSLRRSGRYGRPQTPCLLYTSASDGDSVACLYSLAEKRVYKLTLPEPPIRTRYLIGSSNGWLVTADERSELHMVNPITGEQVALPSVTTIEQVKPVVDDAGSIREYEFSQYYGEEEIAGPSIHALGDLRDYLYDKAFVFPTTPLGSYIVVLIHSPIGQLSFAKAGDRSWTWLPPGATYEDCIYMDGLLYAVTSSGGIEVFDITGPIVSRKVITDSMKDYNYEHMYIVQAPSGDLLQIWREQDVSVGNSDDVGASSQHSEPLERFSETRKIMVYKVDMGAKKLVEVDSLHDHVLFLGLSQSHCGRAQEYPELKENHVYLTDDDQGFALWKSKGRDIVIFNLENSSKEEIVSPPLWCSWPAPIWITLSHTKLSSGSNI